MSLEAITTISEAEESARRLKAEAIAAAKAAEAAAAAEGKAAIEAAAPNAVVSVPQNSFPADRTRRGGQVFFREGAAAGQALAGSIQARLNALSGGTFSPLRGDYFMLNCTNYPSVIVECGFLSNPEDERLLSGEDYRAQVAYAVFCGVLAFLA